MKKAMCVVLMTVPTVLVALSFPVLTAYQVGAANAAKPQIVVVKFSPAGGGQQEIVDRIGNARSEIFLQAYDFTAEEISSALVKAAGRGVKVHSAFDHKTNWADKRSKVAELERVGAEVVYDAKHPIAHSKVIVIDAEIVLTGSYNFSEGAERNLENLLTIKDKSIAKLYIDNWHLHAKHCVKRN